MNLRLSLPVLPYALLPVAFIAINLLSSAPPDSTVQRWPQLSLPTASAVSSVSSRLDIAVLKQSVNRLPGLALLRQAGNSLRIASGQRLSWCLWGNSDPPMLFHSVELWASEGLVPAQNRKVMDDVAATIRKYDSILRNEGWILVVVPVPTKLSLYSKFCDWPVLEKDVLTRRPVDRDRAGEIYGRLVSELRSEGIHVVDLDSVFRTHRTLHPSDLLYPLAETHWSGLGLKLAADATAELVSSSSAIRRRQFAPSYIDVEEVADIARGFNPLPEWTGPLGPVYKYKDRLVNGEEGRGFPYSADPKSLLYVAGTSYSGQFTWLVGEPVGFAWAIGGQLEECEFVNGAEAGHGSFAAFARFLAERERLAADFTRRRNLQSFPRVVVWEFPIRDAGSIGNN